MNRFITACLISLLLFTTPLNAHAGHQEEEDNRDFSVTKLTDNIHVLMGINGFTGGNIALLTGEDGVIMVDDSMPPLGDRLRAAIKKVTDSDVDFIINTHIHGDHIGLNAEFANAGSWIIGHENLRKMLKEKGFGPDKPKEALPVITFDSEMSFHLNEEQAKIIHIAAAHTDGDAMIYYSDANIIHTGDLMFNGMFPFIDLSSGGDVYGYLKAQKQMLALSNDKTKIIPGHGPMATKADLQAAVDMLEDSIAIVKVLVDKGMSETDVIASKPLQKYHDTWNWRFITTERMTRQLYRGIKGS